MNQNDCIVWAFEEKLLRSVRYGVRGRESWVKAEAGVWPIVEKPQEATAEEGAPETPATEAGEVVDADDRESAGRAISSLSGDPQERARR